MDVPLISVEQMRSIEGGAERMGVEVAYMMENAGHRVAALARDKLRKLSGLRVVVLAGKGHNGGDGLVAARFLRNWGADVTAIVAEHPEEMAPLTKWHFGVLRSMFVPLMTPVDFMKFETYIGKAELIVDALLGYNIDGDPRNFYATLIEHALAARKNKAKILAVDVPSGLNADTGLAYNPCIRADWTLALTLPKRGLAAKEAKEYAGEIYVTDVGVPHEVFEYLGIPMPRLFAEKDIIRFK